MTVLAETLRRFHAAITGAAPLDSARSLVERGRVDEIDRLRVYAHAYVARIGDVLAQDFPKLEVALPSVRPLTAAYLRAHPPCDPSLREVGQHVATFLDHRGDPPHLGDLARLERARVEVFDGPDAPALTRDDLSDLGAEAFPSLRLRLVPSSQLVELRTNADELWDAIENAHEVPRVEACQRTVLVWRRDLTIIHRTLDADEVALVRALRDGTSFATACELLVDTATPTERALELLLRWLDGAILMG